MKRIEKKKAVGSSKPKKWNRNKNAKTNPVKAHVGYFESVVVPSEIGELEQLHEYAVGQAGEDVGIESRLRRGRGCLDLDGVLL